MTDLRESVARAICAVNCCDVAHPCDRLPDGSCKPEKCCYGGVSIPHAEAALRAVADAGPSEKMVEAAARQLAQRHIEDSPLPLRGMTMGMWVDDNWQDFATLARAAVAAALKEMG